MASIPKDLKYTKDHEWARLEGELVRVGITTYAVEQLGDVTLVDLPKVGTRVANAAHFGDIESVKAVSELYLPVAGEITDVNNALADAPETVNSDPHGEGWMVTVKIADAGELAKLMRAADYEKYVKEEGGE